MKIEKQKCDNCKKEVIDYYAEKFWIHMGVSGNGGLQVYLTGGRKNNLTPINMKFIEAKILDFCSVECMVKHLTGKDYIEKPHKITPVMAKGVGLNAH